MNLRPKNIIKRLYVVFAPAPVLPATFWVFEDDKDKWVPAPLLWDGQTYEGDGYHLLHRTNDKWTIRPDFDGAEHKPVRFNHVTKVVLENGRGTMQYYFGDKPPLTQSVANQAITDSYDLTRLYEERPKEFSCGYCGSTAGLDDGENQGYPACVSCGGV